MPDPTSIGRRPPDELDAALAAAIREIATRRATEAAARRAKLAVVPKRGGRAA